MKLKLKESIRNRGTQIRPPAVIDTQELGIGDKEALWLVSRGTADHYDEPAADAPAEIVADVPAEMIEQPAEQPEGQPEVVDLGDEPAADAPAPTGKKSGKRK